MPFTVHVEPSGHQFEVDAGETVLAAALRHNVGLPYGCRDGKCGSCSAQQLAGVVDYPEGTPAALEGAAAGACICCQAVPRQRPAPAGPRGGARRRAGGSRPALPGGADRPPRARRGPALPQASGAAALQFLAGQYLEFLLADGRARAFSIANAPHDDALIELHLRHIPGGRFTDHVFSQMKERRSCASARRSAPSCCGRTRRGRSCSSPAAPASRPSRHDRARLPRRHRSPHAPLLGRCAPSVISTCPTCRASGPRRTPASASRRSCPSPRGVAGAPRLRPRRAAGGLPDLSGADLYMAGPPVMIAAARAGFTAAGLPLERLYSDAFEYAKDPVKP